MVQTTRATKPVSDKSISRSWHHIDVSGKVLGRVANEIATYLQGKNKRNYVPYLDMGDYVVVTNASKVTVTGNKLDKEAYSYYSGYPGGKRDVSMRAMLEQKPQEVIRHAVSGMLPKNKLRDRRLARLFVYPNEDHPYVNKFQTQQAK